MLDGHFIDPADAAENFQEVDFVVVYCPQCHERVEFPIAHPNAAGNYYQSVNIPEKIAIAMKWDPKSVFCETCNHHLVVDKQYEQPKRVELQVRIDGSNMSTGHNNWYDDVGGSYYGI